MKTNSTLVKARKLSIFSVFILMSINIYAQAPEIQWQKCLGGSDYDKAYSIQQTSDGGFIVAGYTYSNDGDVLGNRGVNDYWVVKLTSSGVIQWQKCLGGFSSDEAYSIQQTSDGGYIVAGGTWSNNGDVSGNHGDYDYWIVKLNSLGIIEWQKCLGGSDDDVASSIQQISDGGFIVAGYTFSNDGDVSGNYGPYDSWVVKLTSSGDIQWQKCLGGSGRDWASFIQQTSDGGFIVAGYTESNDGDVSGKNEEGSYIYDYDYWVVKLTSSGVIEWQKCLGGSFIDWAYSIQQTSDGGFIVAGYTESNDGDVSGNHGISDWWIVKLSPTVGIINTQEASENIKIYPNPTANINIELIDQKESILYVKIYNVNGVKVLEKELTQSKTNIDLSDYTPGLYIINITNNKDEILKMDKIIIE